MPPPRQLILAAATHYHAGALAPFIGSWHRNLPVTELVIFGNHLTPATVGWLRDRGAQGQDQRD